MLWDIFCRVIDNFGDIGVCWRLSADLAARGHHVRLWVDDSRALTWMAPGALEGNWPGIAVHPWDQACAPQALQHRVPAQVWLETFGCTVPEAFLRHFASQSQDIVDRPVWVNVEYLSAEPYVERSHGLPSPVLHGHCSGWTKHFFYPGFTAKTGGLLREPGMADRTYSPQERAAFLAHHGVATAAQRVVSLFCYEPPLLPAVLAHLASAPEQTALLVTHGRAARAVQALMGEEICQGALQVTYLPLLSQTQFDTLLGVCDLNFVRGEDSVVRAIWAGKPFVWHIYPQDDGADQPKLEAFMAQLGLAEKVRRLQRAWNGLASAIEATQAISALDAGAAADWQQQVQVARSRLLKMDDLCTQLVQFVQKKR